MVHAFCTLMPPCVTEIGPNVGETETPSNFILNPLVPLLVALWRFARTRVDAGGSHDLPKKLSIELTPNNSARTRLQNLILQESRFEGK